MNQTARNGFSFHDMTYDEFTLCPIYEAGNLLIMPKCSNGDALRRLMNHSLNLNNSIPSAAARKLMLKCCRNPLSLA